MADIDLAPEDIEVLMEALEAWVKKDAAGHIMGTVITSFLSKDKTKEEVEAKLDLDTKVMHAKEASRREVAILLQAKLITLKTQMTVNQASRIANGGAQ